MSQESHKVAEQGFCHSEGVINAKVNTKGKETLEC